MDASSWFIDTVQVKLYLGPDTAPGAKGDPTFSATVTLRCRLERGDFTYRDSSGNDVNSDARISYDDDCLTDAGITPQPTGTGLRPGLDLVLMDGAADSLANTEMILRVDRARTKDGSYTKYEALLG